MTYDYVCPVCGKHEERSVLSDDRDQQFCRRLDGQGKPVRLHRVPHFTQVHINQPCGFMTSKEMVMGAPGSKARDEFEADIRSGKTVPAGPGSRWI